MLKMGVAHGQNETFCGLHPPKFTLRRFSSEPGHGFVGFHAQGLRRMKRFLPCLVALLAALGTQAAVAQSYCDRLRSELNAPGGDSETQGYIQALNTARSELGQTNAQARQVGCEPSRFLIFSTTPAQCRGYEARIDNLKERVRVLEQRVSQGGQRRNQLLAAYRANCQGNNPVPPGNVGTTQARSRNILDMLFGAAPDTTSPEGTFPQDVTQGGVIAEPGDSGPRRLICVRKCDGYFFPLAGASGSAASDGELCRAQCPNADVEVFVSPAYGDLKYGVSLSGTPYTSLPNAFKYRTSYDPTCSCRKPGQSWSEALTDAERMIGGRRGETIVTEEKSLEMSRPKEAAPRATPQQPRQQQGRPNQQASPPQQAAQPAQPATGAARPVVSQDQGEWVEVKNADGTTRKVRVVAPQGGPATAKPTGQ